MDADGRHAHLADAKLSEGDWLSIDSGSGGVFLGRRDIITELPEAELDQLKRWREAVATRQSA
jgi:pyruvate,orthophosphate dikinase